MRSTAVRAAKVIIFQLLPPGVRGTDEESIRLERPVILDPCKKEDCDLLAFQADERPILHPLYADDPIAKERVEKSKILLNMGRPPLRELSQKEIRELRRGRRQGKVFRDLAYQFGVSVWTAHRLCKGQLRRTCRKRIL